MRAFLILTCAVCALCMSAAAAAADLAEGEMAPGLHVSFAFGGAAHGAPLQLQPVPGAPFVDPKLNAAESEGLSSTTTWIIVGVLVAGAVVLAVNSHHGGGSGTGGGY